MKTLLPLLLVCAASPSFAQRSEPPPAPAGVVVRSEAADLAAGFAAAFQSFASRPVFLVFERNGRTTVLMAVKSVEAAGGTVVVRLESRVVYVLNPRDIVMISDDTPPRS